MSKHSLSWFLRRIGKRLRRKNGFTCTCNDCFRVKERGVYVHDATHAGYLKICQDEMGLNYVDWREK